MEIYGSTSYVDPSKNKEWLQLKVISQWDWSSKAVCYQTLKSFNTDVLISYKLVKHTMESDTIGKVDDIEVLTPEMKEYLIEKGYSVP